MHRIRIAVTVALVGCLSPAAWAQTGVCDQDDPGKYTFPPEDLDESDLRGCLDVRTLVETGFGRCPPDSWSRFCDAVQQHPLEPKNWPEDQCVVQALVAWSVCRDVTAGQLAEDKLGPPARAACVAATRGREITDEDHRALRASCDVHPDPARGFAGAAGPALPVSIVLGVTDFFLARAEKEVTLFIKERVFDVLCNGSEEGDLRDLLPATCSIVRPDDKETLDGVLAAIPAAFRRDLLALPGRLVVRLWKDLPDAAKTALKDEACLAYLVLDAAPTFVRDGIASGLEKISEHTPPVPNPCDGTDLRKLKAATKALGMVLDGLGKAVDAGRIVSPETVAYALAEFNDSLKPDELTWLRKLVPVFVRWSLALRDVLKEGSEPSTSELRALVAASGDLLIAVLKQVLPPGNEDAIENVQGVAGIVEDLILRNYVSAIVRLVSLPPVRKAVAGCRKGDEGCGIAFDGLLAGNDEAAALARHVLQYVPLVAAIADAKSAEEVEAALEAAAEPIGTWREYRARPWAFFIGGLLGIGGGAEVPLGSGLEPGGVFGPILPIGLETAVPLGADWTFNIFLSIFDLGGLASTRLDDGASSKDVDADGQAEQASEVELMSLLGPGLFLGVGLGDSPFVFYVGAQYFPDSREFFVCGDDGVCADTESRSVVRVQATLAVDLPAFGIF